MQLSFAKAEPEWFISPILPPLSVVWGEFAMLKNHFLTAEPCTPTLNNWHLTRLRSFMRKPKSIAAAG